MRTPIGWAMIKTSLFQIPMRGNEDLAYLVAARPNEFQIPMRGNEKPQDKRAAVDPSQFQIPMRGNEW